MNKTEYQDRFGEEPVMDDLDRVNCNQSGEIGHNQCGICPEHDKPRFYCGCLNKKENEK